MNRQITDAIDRYMKYKDDGLEKVINNIQSGTLKAGKYIDMIKVRRKDKMNENKDVESTIKANKNNNKKNMDLMKDKDNDMQESSNQTIEESSTIEYFTE